ncbi:MAG TPA: D-glycero-beta-D-manno-heptose-7-phosphate kinase [Chitinispirillaceae bacterium]|nr:D-glycero-beta-D-manno-heptose-7-phosphate kinase [Fibrobacter sp.]HLV32375.1 D-glycero-beta-D-manno-heptose-7-phosphate kinase [Chitinispirillaceae bacterium]
MKDLKFSSQRLKEIIDSFKKTSIIVVGDVMLDEYFWGDVSRISPEAPVPVLEVQSISRRLGGAANVVQNLAKIGIQPDLLSVCGKDENGVHLKSMLDKIGCNPDSILISEKRPTTIKTRIVARNQQIVRADRELAEDLDIQESEYLWNSFNDSFEKSSGVIISDYGKGVISQPLLGKIIEKCTSLKKFISVDPKERHFELYKGVSVMTPNLKEAHTMLGVPYRNCSDTEVRDLGWRIVEKLELSYLLITLSERGMALFDRSDRSFIHLPTTAQKVFDVTGAGDTVISLFSAAYSSGASPLEAAILANHAAGITVAEPGTVSVDPQTLLENCESCFSGANEPVIS